MTAPQLTGWVVGITDPRHRTLERRVGQRTSVIPVERQWRLQRCRVPTLQGPPVVSKTGSKESTESGSSGITRSPSEQLGSTIARKHPITRQPVDRRDRLPVSGLVSIGVITKGRLDRTGATGRPGSQRGTGIQQLRWPTTQHICNRVPVAAVAQVDAHPDSRYKAMTSPA